MNEQALKERLKLIAKLENRPFHVVWRSLILERLLVRLAHSNYHDKFIFKGGLLLSHYLIIGRETKDIDLLARKLKMEMLFIENAFIEICDVNVDDGFKLFFVNIAELSHAHYRGYRVRLNVQFEKMKDCIQIDIGVGDVVEPREESFELYHYRGKPIFEGSVSLQVYPVETIFSEKLESIIARGAANSRMKDFHDILLLCREKGLINSAKLKIDIENTFQQRKTNKSIPINFTEDEYIQLQSLWVVHLQVLGEIAKSLELPEKIAGLIEEVNDWFVSQNMVFELATN